MPANHQLPRAPPLSPEPIPAGKSLRRQHAQRLLFRKLEKAFNEEDFELARLRQENEALRSKLEATTKTKKVIPDPNKQCTTIEQIHEARRAWVQKCSLSRCDPTILSTFKTGVPIMRVVLSLDGHLCAAVSADGLVRIVETATGNLVKMLPSPPKRLVIDVAFSWENELIATGLDDGKVTLWMKPRSAITPTPSMSPKHHIRNREV